VLSVSTYIYEEVCNPFNCPHIKRDAVRVNRQKKHEQRFEILDRSKNNTIDLQYS
jgi:hypothetical protein